MLKECPLRIERWSKRSKDQFKKMRFPKDKCKYYSKRYNYIRACEEPCPMEQR
jgi:hypothetical protein